MKRSLFHVLVALAVGAIAPQLSAQSISSADRQTVIQAVARGQLIYRFDQAAWHATDAMLEDAKLKGRIDALKERYHGWIVRRVEGGNLEVLFFDKTPDVPRVLYSALMSRDGRQIVSSRFVEGDSPPVDADALRMIRARSAAADVVAKQKVLRCAEAPFNTVVLPPEAEDGEIPVYFLSPQSVMEKVPFGGHARVMVASDGTVGPVHAFTKSCVDLPTSTAKDAPVALVATQLLDPLPTEIGIFTMFVAGLPIFVGTPDKRTWVIEASGGQARVRLIDPDTKKK